MRSIKTPIRPLSKNVLAFFKYTSVPSPDLAFYAHYLVEILAQGIHLFLLGRGSTCLAHGPSELAPQRCALSAETEKESCPWKRAVSGAEFQKRYVA